jgi:hypothetical protein
MFERLKQGAIYALIMAFLAQPVWPGPSLAKALMAQPPGRTH